MQTCGSEALRVGDYYGLSGHQAQKDRCNIRDAVAIYDELHGGALSDNDYDVHGRRTTNHPTRRSILN